MNTDADVLRNAVRKAEALRRLQQHPDWRMVIEGYTLDYREMLLSSIHIHTTHLPQLQAIGWFNTYLQDVLTHGDASALALEELLQGDNYYD